MKWFFGLVLVVALIVGALYGVGRFLLPNDLMVTRSTVVERPRAAVFAMTNDLRIVKEWSPYYAMDPDADYAFSGEEAGPGQTMRWSSKMRQVGDGRMSIVRAVENREVETLLEMRERATLNSRLEMLPAEKATSVSWTVSAQCATGAVNVPCRYMNLVLARMIERDLDSGLQRLKTLTEQLPDVDFEGLDPVFENVEPQPYVFSVASTSATDQAEVDRAEALCLKVVNEFMTEYQMSPAGPLVRVTTKWDAAESLMEFRVGYPFAGPRPLTVATVQIGETPRGRALRVLHAGPRGEMRATYAKIYAYLQAHRVALREDGLPWEIVLNDGAVDPNATRIEIYVPLQ